MGIKAITIKAAFILLAIVCIVASIYRAIEMPQYSILFSVGLGVLIFAIYVIAPLPNSALD